MTEPAGPPSSASPEAARPPLDRAHDAAFELGRFFPYRLAVLAERVSQAVASVYADRFDLTRAEWRVVAALAANGEMAAKEIGPYSTLDKMQVSRAVARLEDKGAVERREDASDRRAKILRLTAHGAALFQELHPLVVEREAYILGALAPADRAALDRILDAVLTRAGDLADRPSGSPDAD